MGSVSKSAAVRARLHHPVIDSDGHTVEFEPAVMETLKEVGGPSIVERYKTERSKGMAASLGNLLRWHHLTPEERRDERATVPPWWALPAKNTLDRATSTLPKLLYERLDDFGLDVTILYPTFGLIAPHLDDEEIRRATCRAFNIYHSRIFSDYTDRLIPVAVVPMHAPQEAIEELEYAVKRLGMKAVMLAGHVLRQVPSVMRKAPEAGQYAYWVDNLCLDSEYDYDPVWAKCCELKVAPTFHSGGMGWGSRTSISTYMYNHIGHFGAAGEALCKAMIFGGVTRRFPQLKCAFLEGGVSWGATLYSDLIARWKKRNGQAVENYNPANLNSEELLSLFERYGHKEVVDKLDQFSNASGQTINTRSAPAQRNDFWRCGIEKAEDIKDLFVPHFYFGCEADDPTNATAFNAKANPFGARIRAIFSSDIGHWDVPSFDHPLREAYEQVEHGLLTAQQFQEFTFTNAVRYYAGNRPDFFAHTTLDVAARAVLGERSSG